MGFIEDALSIIGIISIIITIDATQLNEVMNKMIGYAVVAEHDSSGD